MCRTLELTKPPDPLGKTIRPAGVSYSSAPLSM